MRCKKYHFLLPLFIENQLHHKEMQKVKDHLRNCSRCRKEVEELIKINSMCKEIPDVNPPPELHKKILSVVSLRERKDKKTSFNIRLLAGIAAVFVVLFFGLKFMNQSFNLMLNKDQAAQEREPIEDKLVNDPFIASVGISEKEGETEQDDTAANYVTDEIEDESITRSWSDDIEDYAESQGIIPAKDTKISESNTVDKPSSGVFTIFILISAVTGIMLLILYVMRRIKNST